MLGLPLLTAHNAQALRSSARNRLRPALGCMRLPGLSRSGSALRQLSEAQIWLGLCFVPFPGQVAQVFGERGRCDLLPFPCLLVSLLGVPLAPLLRRMVAVQNPKKT